MAENNMKYESNKKLLKNFLKAVKKYDELCKKQEIPIDKLLKDWAEKLWQKK
jgi:lysophospholipase L1-like esterase